MSELLCFFGHHKCGSAWVAQIANEVCVHAGLTVRAHSDEKDFAGDIEALRATTPFDFWIYANADVVFTRPVDLRGFHVVRDPRDLIVSAYFSHLDSHPDAHWPRLRHYRPYLRSLSRHDGLLAEMDFNAEFLAHMLTWDYRRPNVLELRFEDLIAAPEVGFERVFQFLGLLPRRTTRSVLRDVIARYSFERLSGGRRPGVEDSRHHYRRGRPGDWRNHFAAEHVAHFKRLYNPLLLKLGYETVETWT